MLVAYHRGRMAPDHGVTGGLMAAVGLGAAAADARASEEGLPGRSSAATTPPSASRCRVRASLFPLRCPCELIQAKRLWGFSCLRRDSGIGYQGLCLTHLWH